MVKSDRDKLADLKRALDAMPSDPKGITPGQWQQILAILGTLLTIFLGGGGLTPTPAATTSAMDSVADTAMLALVHICLRMLARHPDFTWLSPIIESHLPGAPK